MRARRLLAARDFSRLRMASICADQRLVMGIRSEVRSFAIDEEEVIHFVTIFQKRLANRNPLPCRQIDRVAVLQNPAALCQQPIDFFAREVLWAGHEPRKLTEFYFSVERKNWLKSGTKL